VRIASYDMGGHLTVTTSDSGIGMNAQRLAELFPANEETPEPIRSSSGLGLGLLICRTVVQAHGGTLTATSRGLGLGSTFEVRLRRITGAAVTKVQAPPVPASAPRSSLRILLVEDHPDTAEMLSMLLRHHGFEVEVAGSVDAALDLAQSSGCDVLVSDVRLPDGSGMDLMRRLRESQFVRGIAMSGFGTQDDVRRSKEAGYDEHLVKPVDVGRLIEAIHKVAERTH